MTVLVITTGIAESV